MRRQEFRENALTAVLAVLVLAFSMVVAPFYVEGDQALYRRFYEEVIGLGIEDVLILQLFSVGSREPIYGLLVSFFAPFMAKDVFSSIQNSVLAFLCARILRKWGAHWIFIYVLALSNFYLYVLYFTADRLRLAMIFLLMMLNYRGLTRGIGSVLAPLSHAQVLLAYACIALERAVQFVIAKVPSRRVTVKGLVYTVAAFGVGVAILSILWEHLVYKLELGGYASKGVEDGLRSSALLVLALFYARSKIGCLAHFAPIILASLIFGDERINIFAYFFFIYHAAQYRAGLSVINLAIATYFGIKGVDFLINVFRYGHGFPEL